MVGGGGKGDAWGWSEVIHSRDTVMFDLGLWSERCLMDLCFQFLLFLVDLAIWG